MPYLYELMQAGKSETNRFLSPIGRSVNVPEIPFTEKQVDTVRYYNQHQGSDAEYIPPGLTLEDLAKLGKIDSSLFSVRNHLMSPTTRGGWVMSLYGLVPETIGVERKLCYPHHDKLLENFGLSKCFVDFGNVLDHVYLKLLFLKRTGQHHLGWNVCWTNEFLMDSVGAYYMVIAHTPHLGLYVQMRFTDKGPDIGSSPLIYPTHPVIRPRE